MKNLFREPLSEPTSPAPQSAEPAQEKPSPNPTNKKQRFRRVAVYEVLFFAVAFLLLFWSFLMTNRSSKLMTALKENAAELESTISEAGDLSQRVELLERQLAAEQAENERLKNTTLAMEWLEMIRSDCEKDRLSSAKQHIVDFEKSGLVSALPETSLNVAADGFSPAERYQALRNRIFPNGVPK